MKKENAAVGYDRCFSPQIAFAMPGTTFRPGRPASENVAKEDAEK